MKAKAVLSNFCALMLLLVSFSSTEATGQGVGCGSTITTSVVLQEDLNCSGTGLVIGADSIVVNLNGHQIVGTGAPGATGILVNRHSGVQITGGDSSIYSLIRDFAVDVRFVGGRGDVLKNVNLDGNGWGLTLDGTQFATAQNISTQTAAGGVWVTGVGNSIINSSIMSLGIGILGPGGKTATYLTNISGNGFFSNKVGIQLEGRVLRTLITQNTFRHTQTAILLGPLPTPTATAIVNNEFDIDDNGINLGNANGSSVVNNLFSTVMTNLICGTATGSVFSGNTPSSVNSQCLPT